MFILFSRKLVRERPVFDVHGIDAFQAAKHATKSLPRFFLHGTGDYAVPHKHGVLLDMAYPRNIKKCLPLDGLEHDSPRPMAALERSFALILSFVLSSASQVLQQKQNGIHPTAMSISSRSGSISGGYFVEAGQLKNENSGVSVDNSNSRATVTCPTTPSNGT